ncbi:hypothetical protein ABHN87_001652 [Campylobacter upsaliensis]
MSCEATPKQKPKGTTRPKAHAFGKFCLLNLLKPSPSLFAPQKAVFCFEFALPKTRLSTFLRNLKPCVTKQFSPKAPTPT